MLLISSHLQLEDAHILYEDSELSTSEGICGRCWFNSLLHALHWVDHDIDTEGKKERRIDSSLSLGGGGGGGEVSGLTPACRWGGEEVSAYHNNYYDGNICTFTVQGNLHVGTICMKGRSAVQCMHKIPW